MGVGAGLYMCDVVKKFTFAISSPGEFLLTLLSFLTNKRVHNVYTKNLLAVGAPRQIPLGGGFTTLLQTPQVGPPDGSQMWRSHPTTRAFSARAGLWCPNYGHPIYYVIPTLTLTLTLTLILTLTLTLIISLILKS